MILYLMTFLCQVINLYVTLIDIKVEKDKQFEDNPKNRPRASARRHYNMMFSDIYLM